MDDLPNIDADLTGDTPSTLSEPDKPWRIVDDSEAAWAVRKRRSAEARIAGRVAVARTFYERIEAERAEVDAWLAKVTRDDARTVEVMSNKLEVYLHDLVDNDPSVRSHHVVGATLKFAPGRERVTVDDVGAFAEWAHRAGREDLLRRKTEVDANAVKAALADSDAEAARIVAEARDAAARLESDTVTRAEAEAVALRERAAGELVAARRQAESDLAGELSRLALGAAEQVVHSNLDDATHQDLIEAYIRQVGATN